MRIEPGRVAASGTALVMAAALAGCSSADSTSSKDPEFTMGVTQAVQGWDPYRCVGATRTVLTSAYDTLTRVTPDGTAEPSLAESWEYETPKRFTMTLREGVQFDDGTPLDAEVVKANLERSVATPSGVTAQFAADQPRITVNSDTELTIALAKPDPDLAHLFANCGGMIVHPDLVANPDKLASEVNGTGPYTFDSGASIADSKYVFVKKDDHWNSEAYPFAKATFSVIPDSNAMISALISGDIDIANGTFQNVAQVEAAGKSAIYGNVSPFAILLNDRDGELVPALEDVRVRQALNYAVDRPAIIKTLFGDKGIATPQIPAEGVPGYDSALDDVYPYDPEKAKALLAEAGYPNGFSLTVLTTSVNQFDTFVSAVADYWDKVGVDVKQDVRDFSTFFTGITTKDYPAVFQPLRAVPAYAALNTYFGPNSRNNPFGSSDPQFAASMDKAATGDEAALREASARVLDQAWYVSVGLNAQYIFFDPATVTGLEMLNSDNTPLFYNWQPASS